MAEQKEQKSIRHLVRIANTDLDGKKPLHQALLKIKGVGVPFANMVIGLAGLDKNAVIGTMPEDEVGKVESIIKNPFGSGAPRWMLNRRRDPESNEDKHLIVADLDYTKENDIKLLRKIKSYKGIRHGKGLPVRGQRTRSNFRKNKGKVRLGVQRKKTTEAAPAKPAKK